LSIRGTNIIFRLFYRSATLYSCTLHKYRIIKK